MGNGNVDFNPEMILDQLESLTDSPHSAINIFINMIAFQRPDLMERCAKIYSAYDDMFGIVYSE